MKNPARLFVLLVIAGLIYPALLMHTLKSSLFFGGVAVALVILLLVLERDAKKV